MAASFLASTWSEQYSTAEVPTYAPTAAKFSGYSTPFLEAVPLALQEQMFFNNTRTMDLYLDDFKGVLRGWVVQGEQQSLSSDQQFQTFLQGKLNAYFPVCLGGLQSLYPGLTDTQYRILMVMNLVNGYYNYAGTTDVSNFAALVELDTGDCSEIATLTAALINLQGISATRMGALFNYMTPLGQFYAGHQVVLADGMWIDAETDVAFVLNPATITSLPPQQRLQSLLAANQAYGFYSWYLQPQVRLSQMAQGVDGGDIAFYYYWYLAGIGQGQSLLTTYGPLE